MVVRGYLEKQLKTTFLQNEDSHLFGAIGAGLMLLKEKAGIIPLKIKSFEDILIQPETEKQYFHKPLSLILSKYPDFSNEESYRFNPGTSKHPAEVEVDIYTELTPRTNYQVYIGIDIGSTSTKAILIDETKMPVAGFYTYTVGKPLTAARSILEAIENISRAKTN